MSEQLLKRSEVRPASKQVRRTVEVQVLNVCSRGFGVMADAFFEGVRTHFEEKFSAAVKGVR